MKIRLIKMKIKTKIIVSTFLVVAVSLAISSILTYNYFTGILKEQSIRDNTVKLAQFTYQLKQMQEQALVLLMRITKPLVLLLRLRLKKSLRHASLSSK